MIRRDDIPERVAQALEVAFTAYAHRDDVVRSDATSSEDVSASIAQLTAAQVALAGEVHDWLIDLVVPGPDGAR